MGDMGFEINTAPSKGTVFIKQVWDICSALQRQGAGVDERCGCHIHVDAVDYTYYELKRLLLFYAAVEPVIYGIVPDYRRTSHYCRPCGRQYFQAIMQAETKQASQVCPDGTALRPAKAGHVWRERIINHRISLDGERDIEVPQRIMREEGRNNG